MSTFADAYSRYLTNHFNYTNKFTIFRKYFKNSITSLTDPKFMSRKLIAKIDDFPKYPYFLNALARTDSINLVKIYNSSLDNTENLVESMIGSSELQKRELYDKIPSSVDEFLAEISFQFSYISTPNDLYNYDMIIRSFVSEYQYRNIFSDIYSDLFYSTDQISGETAGLETKSFLYQYMLYTCLYNTIASSHDIYPKLLSYITYINTSGMAVDRVDQAIVLSDFQLFVNAYHTNMSVDLAGIIARSMYDFQNLSTTMLQDLTTVIDGKITNVTSGLYDAFYDFYEPVDSFAPADFMANYTVQNLNALVAADVVSKIYDDNNVIDQSSTTIKTLYEENSYSTYMALISESQIKNYLFLCFLYKFWPVKFLNVLQLSIKEYVEAYIKPTTSDLLEKTDYGDEFDYFTNNSVTYVNLSSFLETYLCPAASIVTYGAGTHAKFTFTPGSGNVICSDLASFNAVNIHEFIYAVGDGRDHSAHVASKIVGSLTLVLDGEYDGSVATANVDAYRYSFITSNYLYNVALNYQIPEFAASMYYIYLLEEFFKSTRYNDFIEELTEDIFTYLRNNSHINYDFDWYEYHDVIDVYFKVFLRWKLTDQSSRCILPTYNNAKFKFEHDSVIVYCANLESYNNITDGQYIFSDQDTISEAVQVLSHSIVGTDYILNLATAYPGNSSESYSTTYAFFAADVPLFDNVTNNFSNKLFPRVLTNITLDPSYDINIIIPSPTDLENLFTSFSSSSAFVRSMHQFSENMILSALTRETIYSVLSEFV